MPFQKPQVSASGLEAVYSRKCRVTVSRYIGQAQSKKRVGACVYNHKCR